MKWIVFSMLLVASSVAWAGDSEIDFKGVPFGVSEKEFTEKNPGYRCTTTEPRFTVSSDRSCVVYGRPKDDYAPARQPAGTFGGLPADISVNFYEDRLASIGVFFFASRFSDVLQALTERYGKPDTLESSVVKNRMGAEFLNVIALWRRADVTLKANKYGGDLTESMVSYNTSWGVAEFKNRQAPIRKKATGDL